MDVDLSADGLRYVVQIWLVPTGHNDVRETSTVGCKQLLLNATDGEDLGEDWPTGEQTGERSHIRGWQQLSTHRHASRPQVVAGRRPFRAMCVRAPADRRRLGPRHGAATSCRCPQAPSSSAATTTLSAVDLPCRASLVLARAYSARTAGHVR